MTNDIVLESQMKKKKMKDSKSASSAAEGTEGPAAVVKRFEKYITPELVEEVGKVFVFELSGDEPGVYHLDLKTGKVGQGKQSALFPR